MLDSASRLDLALLHELRKQNPDLSRAKLKEWFKSESITYRGRAASPSEELSAGDHVLDIPEALENALAPDTAQASPRGSFLEILHEDENLLALNKDSGIPSVPHAIHETDTAVSSALAHFPGLEQVGRRGFEPGILHRLDTGTSGVLLFAKNQPTFETLQSLWKTPRVIKTYRALVQSQSADPSPETWQLPKVIATPLAHDPKSSKKMIALSREDSEERGLYRGKPLPALTRIRQLSRLEGRNPDSWDLEIEIETGVMHQIRCHLASVGLPILGDSLYRGGISPRLWLHAWKLKVDSLEITAPLPAHWPGAAPSQKDHSRTDLKEQP
ncbi:MAG: RluA family pseudouridine synthase [Methylotenera sp.]|nr:RluA family pseudouridine synthase [Oligoflexia bacterium]